MRTLLRFEKGFVAGNCNKIFYLLVSNGNLRLVFFHAREIEIKTCESVTLVHMVRINKLEANLAARPETFLDRDA